MTFGNDKTIKGLKDWEEVDVKFKDYTGETDPRNHVGAQSEPKVTYTNFTGRNDFQTLKVARDNQSIFFYAQTTKPISGNNSDNWMRLYLDIDRDFETGWKGYDFRIVQGNQLQKFREGNWVTISQVVHVVSGNEMMITLPRSLDKRLMEALNLEFKWSDKIPLIGMSMEMWHREAG